MGSKIFILLTKIWKFWLSLPQSIRFLLVGGYNTLFAYILFLILYFFFNKVILYPYLLFISYIIAIIHNFFILRIFVFQKRTNKHWVIELFLTFLLYLIIYFINLLLLKILLLFINQMYLAQAIAIFIIPFFTYFLFKKWIYNKKT
jgi:putative flippase GtrA